MVSKKMNKAEKFKSKGVAILEDQQPKTMEEFLNDTPDYGPPIIAREYIKCNLDSESVSRMSGIALINCHKRPIPGEECKVAGSKNRT